MVCNKVQTAGEIKQLDPQAAVVLHFGVQLGNIWELHLGFFTQQTSVLHGHLVALGILFGAALHLANSNLVL